MSVGLIPVGLSPVGLSEITSGGGASDAAARNVCLRVSGQVRSVEYEIRVLVTTSVAGHKPARAGRIYVQ